MTLDRELDLQSRLEVLDERVAILVADTLQRQRQSEALTELAGDLSPITRQAMASATEVLASAGERGYVDFARSGLGVVDRIVTEFTTEDVDALGDNVVLILETIKEMTQPEVIGMMRSTLHHVREVETPAQPPSLLALARRMREPNVRRGLERLLVLLESLGSAETEGPKRERSSNELGNDRRP